MTRSIKALSAVAMLVACALPMTSASAQQDSASAKMRTFDSSSAVSLMKANVVRVDTLKQGDNASLSALVVSGTDSITAMIAPVTFLTSNSLTLAAGDVIDIAGSKMMMGGRSMLVATEIKKGETKVMLRDKATGVPAWPQGAGTADAMRKP